jgi:hypothetical protein
MSQNTEDPSVLLRTSKGFLAILSIASWPESNAALKLHFLVYFLKPLLILMA